MVQSCTMVQLPILWLLKMINRDNCKGTTCFPLYHHFLSTFSNHFRPFPTLADHFHQPTFLRNLCRSLEIIAEGPMALPSLVMVAFQIWEAWYYTWSLVY